MLAPSAARSPKRIAAPFAIQNEDDEFKLGCGNRKKISRTGRYEIRFLDGKVVHSGRPVAKNELRVDVDVNELIRLRVEPIIVENPGDMIFRPWKSLLESQTSKRACEAMQVGPIDEEVDIPIAPSPAKALPMPLPLAIGYLLGGKRIAENMQERKLVPVYMIDAEIFCGELRPIH